MINAIIFDFGNVLYDLNFDLFYTNFSALLDEDVSQGLPSVLAKAVEQYDSGEINTETFIWKIQHYKKGNLDPHSIINCWNSLLDQFPSHRWAFLEKLTKNKKLYLLSNINELHLSTCYKHIRKVHGKVDFETKYFDAVFYSHLIHKIKPYKDVYHYVEQGLGLKGEEIFFVDDKQENVDGALECGWKAIKHDPSNDIVDMFEGYIGQF